MNGGQTDNGDRTSAVAADDRRTAAAEFGHGIAVITGSGSGIGAGLARELASHGMTVVVDVGREGLIVRPAPPEEQHMNAAA